MATDCKKCEDHDRIIENSRVDWSWGMTEKAERAAIATNAMDRADKDRHIREDHV
jgi:hypothetical protein